MKKQKVITAKARAGNIVLAGHSGAYRVIAYLLQQGQVPVQEVFLFDALYGQEDRFHQWIAADSTHHFVHWFTNKGGGTDEVSVHFMQGLSTEHRPYALVEETVVTPAILKANRLLFVHSAREHNVIINDPDDFKLLLENSFILRNR